MASPSSQAARCAACWARGPLGPDPLCPLLFQPGVFVQVQQVGQGDVGPGPGGLPGPLGQQARADQARIRADVARQGSSFLWLAVQDPPAYPLG